MKTGQTDPRFFMLNTIHEYAEELLEASGEVNIIYLRYANFFLQLSANAELGLRKAEQQKWIIYLEQEYYN